MPAQASDGKARPVRLLFVHQNFPGQYRNLLQHLAKLGRHEIVFVTQHENTRIEGVRQILYRPARQVAKGIHRYLRTTEAAILNAQAVWRVATALKKEGFVPDLMIGHNGWGETLFLKDVFPEAPLLAYFEFFYRPTGSDIDFDPEFPDSADTRLRSQVLNATNLMGLECADWGQTPTVWQRNQFPMRYRDRISIVHEGIDTSVVRPEADAWVRLHSDGSILRPGDEVVTYAARNLEPYRGFHVFMRSLPEILRRRPRAHVLIVGGDEVSYGLRLPAGQTYRRKLLAELEGQIDLARVHFLGRLAYDMYLRVLQVSAVHVYLTYPFVLSWSMLEAMSAGCLVVASDTPPVMEFIRHGENGLLTDFFSREGIARAVDEALEAPERHRALRERARKTIVDNYDFRTVCLPGQLRLLEDLLAGTPPRTLRKAARGGVRA
ncbi:MAG TPA: glycosyltransferase family 4 protein [Burkholderiales bacterium]|nr:glycosyltransferase family 4 protein [Burkholderiales bacterium]